MTDTTDFSLDIWTKKASRLIWLISADEKVFWVVLGSCLAGQSTEMYFELVWYVLFPLQKKKKIKMYVFWLLALNNKKRPKKPLIWPIWLISEEVSGLKSVISGSAFWYDWFQMSPAVRGVFGVVGRVVWKLTQPHHRLILCVSLQKELPYQVSLKLDKNCGS